MRGHPEVPAFRGPPIQGVRGGSVLQMSSSGGASPSGGAFGVSEWLGSIGDVSLMSSSSCGMPTRGGPVPSPQNGHLILV